MLRSRLVFVAGFAVAQPGAAMIGDPEGMTGVLLGPALGHAWHGSGQQGWMSFRPEFGWTLFGLDGGYLAALSSETSSWRHGLVLRPFVSVLFASAYYRVGIFPSSHDHFHEVGLLLKVPVYFDRPKPPAPAPAQRFQQ